MNTACPYCRLDTAGNHEQNCPEKKRLEETCVLWTPTMANVVIIPTDFSKSETGSAELCALLDNLLRVIDASPYGEEALHHHTCPAPEHGKCTCGAYEAVDAARKAVVEMKGT